MLRRLLDQPPLKCHGWIAFLPVAGGADRACRACKDWRDPVDHRVTLGRRRAVVLGFFADRGLHGEADIPRLIAASGAGAVYAGPIGAAPGIPTLIADLAPAEPQPIPFLHPAA